MTVKRFFSLPIAAMTLAISFSSADAQSLQRDGGPAETPPASFSGNQYVDSKGCVYIRAGIDGNTSWVPRVNRSRKVVCGLTPSLGASAVAAAAPAPRAPEPVQIGAPNPVAPKSPAAFETQTRTVRSAATTVASILAPKPVRTVASTPARTAPQVKRVNIPQPAGVAAPVRRTAAVRAPMPQVVRAAPQVQPRIVRVAPQPQKVQRTQPARVAAVQGTQTCQGASAVSQQYMNDRGFPRRCGPQTGSIGTTKSQVQGGTFRSASGQVLDAGSISPNAIVVPRHVYDQQQAARLSGAVPQGYRQAWNDGRLNTKRTYQTLGGKAQMDLIWTQTVPRRLIARNTGRDVTRSYPGLRYPYTSMAQQNSALSQGVAERRVVVSTRSARKQPAVRQPAVQQRARVSTKASAPRQPAVAAGKRFVQVGTFGVPSNAQRTAARLQNMGLPVRIGKYVRGGKEMRIVLAGPFASPAHTGGALTALRNAGYRDAFARN